jgi:hypothetical protein
MMMLRRAAREIAPMIATGMAMSSGHGVAITITARNRDGSPLTTHPRMPTPTAAGVYQAPRRSAILRIAGRRCSASRMTRMMRS